MDEDLTLTNLVLVRFIKSLYCNGPAGIRDSLWWNSVICFGIVEQDRLFAREQELINLVANLGRKVKEGRLFWVCRTGDLLRDLHRGGRTRIAVVSECR